MKPAHDLPHYFVEMLDKTPAYKLSAYLSERLRLEHIELLRLRLRQETELPYIDLSRRDHISTEEGVELELSVDES